MHYRAGDVRNGFMRRATPEDAGAIARLHRMVVRHCLPFLPELHSAEEDLTFFREHFLPENEVWLWDLTGIVAYCGFRPGWIAHLYVDPADHGKGIGSALMGKAKEGQSSVRLWVFQRNLPAIAFYQRHGFQLIEQTDGAGNQEREPDALYEWMKSPAKVEPI